MKITKIHYSKTFPTDVAFSPEKIGLEADIDETDNIGQSFDMLRSIARAEHKSNYPHLYQETPPIVEKDTFDYSLVTSSPSEEKITPEKGRQHTKNEIVNCKTLKELKLWELIAKTNDELWATYHEQYLKLDTHDS